MQDNEMMKLRSTNFPSSTGVHSFLFFILDGVWVISEVLSPPLELSSPPEWACWGGGYEYIEGGWYEYGWGVGPPDEPPVGEGGYEYGG
jgi:hypothetical protein